MAHGFGPNQPGQVNLLESKYTFSARNTSVQRFQATNTNFIPQSGVVTSANVSNVDYEDAIGSHTISQVHPDGVADY